MPAAVSTPYAEDILWVLRRHGVPANQLEDALQDVYLIALRQWPDGAPPARSWLLAAAFNVARNRSKSARRRPGHDELRDDHAVLEASPETDYFEAERRAAIVEAIDALPEDVREVFVLHEIDGLSMEQIAAMQAVPLSTVQSRLRRARPLFYKETDRRRAAGVLAAFAVGVQESEPAVPKAAASRHLVHLLAASLLSAGLGAAITFALMRDRSPSVNVEPERAVLVSHAAPVPFAVPPDPAPPIAPAQPPRPTPADADSSVDTELILLERATAEDNAGNYAGALRLLNRHLELFPNSPLASTRDKFLGQVQQKLANQKAGR